jgi:hypothetical protein
MSSVSADTAASFFHKPGNDDESPTSNSTPNVSTDATFGEVLAMSDGMIMVKPELSMTMTAQPGVIITLPATATGEKIDACLLFERFGMYFAELLPTGLAEPITSASHPVVGEFAELKGWKEGKIEKLVVDTGAVTARGLIDFQGTPITRQHENDPYFSGSGKNVSVAGGASDEITEEEATRFRPVFGEPPLQGHRAKV